MDQTSVYLSRFPSRPILITIFLVSILLSFLAGYFFPKFNSPIVTTKPNPIAVSANPVVNVPIATDSSSVKSLYVVYLLSGVVENITPITKNNKSGYEIQMLSPSGPLIAQKFFVSDKATNIVLLDNKGQETKSQLSSFKKGDSIQLNFQIDIKKGSEIQVTKIVLLQ